MDNLIFIWKCLRRNSWGRFIGLMHRNREWRILFKQEAYRHCNEPTVGVYIKLRILQQTGYVVRVEMYSTADARDMLMCEDGSPSLQIDWGVGSRYRRPRPDFIHIIHGRTQTYTYRRIKSSGWNMYQIIETKTFINTVNA